MSFSSEIGRQVVSVAADVPRFEQPLTRQFALHHQLISEEL